MEAVDHIPVLVFDDGSPTGVLAMQRACRVASRVVLATAHGSPNLTENVATADRLGISVEVVHLGRDTGIRHALAECAPHEVHLAYVPHPGEHVGLMLRRAIQAVASSGDQAMPIVAVHIVHPNAPSWGPVVELDPAHVDAGFTALFAAGLAGSLDVPLHVLRLPGDRSSATVRSADALDQARQLIASSGLAVLEERVEHDAAAAATAAARAAYAVVMGIGDLEVHGRKLTSPGDLPDSVLEEGDGELAHHLARTIETDLVVVLDTITLHRGPLAYAVAIGAALGVVSVGAVAAGAYGLATASGAVAAAAAGYAAAGND